MQLVTKRRGPGRPRSTTHGINERLERYRLAEKCAEFTYEVIDFWVKVLRNKPVPKMRNGKPVMNEKGKQVYEPKYTVENQMMAGDRLVERAYGRPITVMDIDQKTRSQTLAKSILEVRWLPPDPTDTSKHIPPESD